MLELGNDRSLIVIGAGGHAKVLIDCLRHAGWNVIGCTDSDPTPRYCAGVPVIGGDDRLEALRRDGVAHAFCALGNNALRDRVGAKLVHLGFDLPAVAGPGTVIAASVIVGAGTGVLPGAVVNIDTILGELVIINTNANVDHDGRIGRAAHIGPGVAIAGEVTVGDRSFIGTGSSIIPQRRIGHDCIVGAGSVVVRDIPDRVVAYGNPARVRKNSAVPG